MHSTAQDSYWDRTVALLGKARVWVATLPKREPAVILGVATSAGVAAQQALAGANVTTWREAVPVLLSVVIRKVVTSPATRDQLLAIAEQDLLNRIKSQTQAPPSPA